MLISEAISDIRTQNLVLPEFQREYVWSREQAKQLLVSLTRKYPVGGLLFWKTQEPPELKNVNTIPERLGTVQVILDGQQRLTTLYMLVTGEIPPYYVSRDITNDIRDLFYNLDDGDLQYFQPVRMRDNPCWVRVVNCFNGNSINVFGIAQKTVGEDETAFQQAQLYESNLSRLRGIRDVDLPIQIVPTEASLNDAIDVFDRLNSLGTKLTDAELALTHVTGKWSQARRTLKAKMDQLEQQRFAFDLTFMTRALVCTVTGHALFEHIRAVERPRLEEGWLQLSKILGYVTSVLPSHAYIHSTRDMSTTNPLIPIVRFLSLNGDKFQSESSLRRGLHWLYMALVHQRYAGQTDSRLEHDVTIVNREDSPWPSLLNQIVDQRGRMGVLPDDFEGRGAGHPLYRMSLVLEPVFKVNSSGSEPLEHEMNHSYMNPSLRAFGQFFVVFAEPPVSAQPPKGALHDPPTGQHLKTMAVWGALDHLNHPASHGVSPIHQLSGIGAIGPDQLEPRKEPQKLAQHQLCPITVLDVRRMHHHGQQQPEGVNHDMAFASFHLLASVIATWAPFSVVFTLWLSIMAAEGVGSLPSNSRTLGRKVSWIRSQVPPFRQRRKYPHAVLHGGRSWGIIRQVQPLRSTYRMPFMTSRMSTVRGRPPGLASGISGASSSHWTSVRSLG